MAKIVFAGREINLPQSRLVRIATGVLLVIFGLLGFLPILGFWMLPLGLLILSYDIAFVRKHRRKMALWQARRKKKQASEQP